MDQNRVYANEEIDPRFKTAVEELRTFLEVTGNSATQRAVILMMMRIKSFCRICAMGLLTQWIEKLSELRTSLTH